MEYCNIQQKNEGIIANYILTHHQNEIIDSGNSCTSFSFAIFNSNMKYSPINKMIMFREIKNDIYDENLRLVHMPFLDDSGDI